MLRKHLAASAEESALTPPVAARGAVNQGVSMRRLMQIIHCPRGGTAIEYALIASLISVAAIVGMNNLGNKLGVMFNNVSNHL
jgi:pilus assembly protein Flp/PilA